MQNFGSQVFICPLVHFHIFGGSMSQSQSKTDTRHPTDDSDQSVPKRNRWHRRRCNTAPSASQPPGLDHSLGFPQPKTCQSEAGSSQSEVIMFSTPILSHDDVGSVLHPIQESHPTNLEMNDATSLHDNDHEDPWRTHEDDSRQLPYSHSNVQCDDPWLCEDDSPIPTVPT